MPKPLIKTILLYFVLLLALLPFLILFNAVLTRLVEPSLFAALLQERIVPYEAKLIGIIITPFGVPALVSHDQILINGEQVRITWNCLGWQSLLLFFLSLCVGLPGFSYTARSKVHAIILGLFGIFWVNIFRMSFTVLLAGYSMPLYKIVYHDYLAAIVTILYVLGFWWFAYQYILEEKGSAETA